MYTLALQIETTRYLVSGFAVKTMKKAIALFHVSSYITFGICITSPDSCSTCHSHQAIRQQRLGDHQHPSLNPTLLALPLDIIQQAIPNRPCKDDTGDGVGREPGDDEVSEQGAGGVVHAIHDFGIYTAS